MKVPHLALGTLGLLFFSWMWLHFIHDPRVRQGALDEIRIDSILVDNDSLKARTDRRTARIDSLEGLSVSLQDSLAGLAKEQGQVEIVREGATGATDAVLDSVSRETSDTLALVRIRFTLQRERKAWVAEVQGLKRQLSITGDLLDNAEARILLLSQNTVEVQSALNRTIVDWLDAEGRYQRARNPGFFRRLEISLPFAALGAVAGLLAGLGAR